MVILELLGRLFGAAVTAIFELLERLFRVPETIVFKLFTTVIFKLSGRLFGAGVNGHFRAIGKPFRSCWDNLFCAVYNAHFRDAVAVIFMLLWRLFGAAKTVIFALLWRPFFWDAFSELPRRSFSSCLGRSFLSFWDAFLELVWQSFLHCCDGHFQAVGMPFSELLKRSFLRCLRRSFSSCCGGRFQDTVTAFWSCWDGHFQAVETAIFELLRRLFGAVWDGHFWVLLGRLFKAAMTLLLLCGRQTCGRGGRGRQVGVQTFEEKNANKERQPWQWVRLSCLIFRTVSDSTPDIYKIAKDWYSKRQYTKLSAYPILNSSAHLNYLLPN